MGIILDRPCLSRSSFVHIQYSTTHELPLSLLSSLVLIHKPLMPCHHYRTPASRLRRAYANAWGIIEVGWRE
jgi:hypothetical protein